MPAPEISATLIAAPGALTSSLVETIVDKAARNLGRPSSQVFLSDNEAVDLLYTSADIASVRHCLEEFKQDEGIDVLVQAAATRRKKLICADLESTIIEQEMLDEIAEIAGVHEEVASITRQTMNGEIDFTKAVKERVALFKGIHRETLTKLQTRITFMPGAETLIATMKAHGATCYLISGGFTFFADPIAKKLGFDVCRANIFRMKGDELTGEVEDPILDKDSKQRIVAEALKAIAVPNEHLLCVGDGANDIPMLSYCHAEGGLGVAFRAKPKVRAVVADQVNGSLIALLFAQGIRRDDFSAHA